jgi:8-oxo-dGTP pyrophosphatase MutT (NUDIX family)
MTMPLIERVAVRLVVLDAEESILLLHTRDLSNETFGTAWELPGGGMEHNESFFEAATRELKEETGLDLHTAIVTEPTWRRDVMYPYRGERRLQHELIAVAHFNLVAPTIFTSARVSFESDDHFEHRWWRQRDISRADERFYPKTLPVQLAPLLSGATITEPLEVWP